MDQCRSRNANIGLGRRAPLVPTPEAPRRPIYSLERERERGRRRAYGVRCTQVSFRREEGLKCIYVDWRQLEEEALYYSRKSQLLERDYVEAGGRFYRFSMAREQFLKPSGECRVAQQQTHIRSTAEGVLIPYSVLISFLFYSLV